MCLVDSVESMMMHGLANPKFRKLLFLAKALWPVNWELKYKIFVTKNSSFTRHQRLIPYDCLFYVGLRNLFHFLVLGQNIFSEQLPIMVSSCMEHKSDENSQENKGVFREKYNQLPSCSLQFLLLWMQIPAHPLRCQLLNARTMAKAPKGLCFSYSFADTTVIV
jgi:hypothetical protein